MDTISTRELQRQLIGTYQRRLEVTKIHVQVLNGPNLLQVGGTMNNIAVLQCTLIPI